MSNLRFFNIEKFSGVFTTIQKLFDICASRIVVGLLERTHYPTNMDLAIGRNIFVLRHKDLCLSVILFRFNVGLVDGLFQ